MDHAEPLLPLSFAQERLWFMHRMAPESPFYNLQIDIPLSLAVDESAWRRVLHEIVQRHEILRTVFATVDGRPAQQVRATMDLPVPCFDLRELPEDAREAAAHRLAVEDARRPFDLAQGPLLRTTLARLADELYVFVLTMHHIVTDGWSMDLLTNEIAVLYEAFARGEPSPLPELTIQYADFAVWQRQTLTDEELSSQLAYWQAQLAGHAAVELPTDHARPAVPSYRGGFQSTDTSPLVVDGLRRLCRKEGATLFMGLLATFQVLLMRYSGQDDIVVGTPIANRNQPETEQLVGFFVNTLVMRGRLDGNPSFRDHLRRVRETALSAYANQDLPFEKLVEVLHPQRDLSRNPVFQVMFVLQNSTGQRSGPSPPPSYQDAPPQDGSVSYGSAKFDLTLYLAEVDGGVSAIFEYSTDLFEDDTIARLITHWQTLLQSIGANPDAPVARLSILPPLERSLLLTEWNRTRTGYPRDATLVELFEAQVAARPDAVALNAAEGRLDYRELSRRSHRLAHWLIAQGVAPGDLVGISLARGVDMVVALLAVLQAGAAYLPLDPGYPPARLDRMISDAKPRLLLSRSDCGTALHQHAPALLDALDLPLDDALPEVALTADSLAYVLYTSGTTGSPKGVCVNHRNVARLVRDTDYCAFGPDEVFFMFAPLQFDASTFEIWGALLNGARLEIAPAGQPSLEDLATAIERGGVTTLWLTASLFHRMVDAHLASLRGVRQLLSGGDVLAPGPCQRVLDELPDCTLINGYGPTETTTFAVCHRMQAGERVGPRVPIGRAISNTRVYVLDDEGQPVPIGVAGELFIGGDGVAAGYLHDNALSAARFVVDHFAPSNSPERLYRTGDRVRFRGDGLLEFLGRRDEQVKVRGFRIELGEIEAQMRCHPMVRDACAVLRQEGDDKRIYGYAVVDRATDAQEVRRFLQLHLPEYMVPSLVIALDKLPMTTNGKVDRSALPLPAGEEWLGQTPFAEPKSEMERLIAAVWCEVLDLKAVGLHDNFFDLGGHSLLLLQVHSRLDAVLGGPLAMVDLFRMPTVEALAAHLSTNAPAPGAPAADPLDKVDERVIRQRQVRAQRMLRRQA